MIFRQVLVALLCTGICANLRIFGKYVHSLLESSASYDFWTSTGTCGFVFVIT